MPSVVTVDPSDKTKWTFSATDWIAEESTTLSSATLTASSTVTIVSQSAIAGATKTCIFSASASGTLACLFVFADGQERERTISITVNQL